MSSLCAPMLMLAGSLGLASQERAVDGNAVTSTATPAVRLVLDDALEYAGGQTIMLSSTTRAEQHFYVETMGPEKRIRRLHWIQFEGGRAREKRRALASITRRPPIPGRRRHADPSARSTTVGVSALAVK